MAVRAIRRASLRNPLEIAPFARRSDVTDPAVEHGFQFAAQMIQTTFAHRHGGDHRHAQFARKNLRVQFQPVAGRKVDHVERDDGRTTERDQFQREAQVIVQVGGIDHHHQRVGKAFARLPAQYDVARHLFVGAGRIEAVGAGQVDQFDRPAVGQRQAARLALHRHAGIIAQFLPRSGQGVEQRALAGIGIADQRDQRQAGHASSSAAASCGPVRTVIAAAWLRRMAIVMRPTLQAMGPRPIRPP